MFGKKRLSFYSPLDSFPPANRHPPSPTHQQTQSNAAPNKSSCWRFYFYFFWEGTLLLHEKINAWEIRNLLYGIILISCFFWGGRDLMKVLRFNYSMLFSVFSLDPRRWYRFRPHPSANINIDLRWESSKNILRYESFRLCKKLSHQRLAKLRRLILSQQICEDKKFVDPWEFRHRRRPERKTRKHIACYDYFECHYHLCFSSMIFFLPISVSRSPRPSSSSSFINVGQCYCLNIIKTHFLLQWK